MDITTQYVCLSIFTEPCGSDLNGKSWQSRHSANKNMDFDFLNVTSTPTSSFKGTF